MKYPSCLSLIRKAYFQVWNIFPRRFDEEDVLFFQESDTHFVTQKDSVHACIERRQSDSGRINGRQHRCVYVMQRRVVYTYTTLVHYYFAVMCALSFRRSYKFSAYYEIKTNKQFVKAKAKAKTIYKCTERHQLLIFPILICILAQTSNSVNNLK